MELNQSSPLNNVTRSLAINTYQLYEFEDRETVEHWFRSFEKQFSVDRLSAFITTLGNAIGHCQFFFKHAQFLVLDVEQFAKLLESLGIELM